MGAAARAIGTRNEAIRIAALRPPPARVARAPIFGRQLIRSRDAASRTFGAADAAVPDAAMTLSGVFDFEPPLRYFHNRDVDARVASGPVVPNTDLPATLVAYLDRAALSIDVATYQFTDEAIADALVRAHQRGVRVRLVMDADNVIASASNLSRLAAEGIGYLDDAANGQPSSALMHDKFLVLDGSLVFTGSYNLTPSGGVAQVARPTRSPRRFTTASATSAITRSPLEVAPWRFGSRPSMTSRWAARCTISSRR